MVFATSMVQRKMTDKLQTRVETLMEERETLRDRVKNLMVLLLPLADRVCK